MLAALDVSTTCCAQPTAKVEQQPLLIGHNEGSTSLFWERNANQKACYFHLDVLYNELICG